MFATHDNETVYDMSNDNHIKTYDEYRDAISDECRDTTSDEYRDTTGETFRHPNKLVITEFAREPVKRVELNVFRSIAFRLCCLGARTKVSAISDSHDKSSTTETLTIVEKQNTSIVTYKLKSNGRLLHKLKSNGNLLSNEIDSCGSPVDPYRRLNNPAKGWF